MLLANGTANSLAGAANSLAGAANSPESPGELAVPFAELAAAFAELAVPVGMNPNSLRVDRDRRHTRSCHIGTGRGVERVTDPEPGAADPEEFRCPPLT